MSRNGVTTRPAALDDQVPPSLPSRTDFLLIQLIITTTTITTTTTIVIIIIIIIAVVVIILYHRSSIIQLHHIKCPRFHSGGRYGTVTGLRSVASVTGPPWCSPTRLLCYSFYNCF